MPRQRELPKAKSATWRKEMPLGSLKKLVHRKCAIKRRSQISSLVSLSLSFIAKKEREQYCFTLVIAAYQPKKISSLKL